MGSGASIDRASYKRHLYTCAAARQPTEAGTSDGTISVLLSLLNGQSTHLKVPVTASLAELQSLIPSDLGGVSGLIYHGKRLDMSSTLREEGVKDGDMITGTLGSVKKLSTIRKSSEWASDSFALLRWDGSVAVWGEPSEGGDSSAVQDRLQEVVEVVGTTSAFCALRRDGQVVCWGHRDFGGMGQPREASLVAAAGKSFAAVTAEGLRCWGRGERPDVEATVPVVALVAAWDAFAALHADGRVSCWGVEAPTVEAVGLSATDGAFAALTKEGGLVVWGDPARGGKLDKDLQNVVEVVGNCKAFAALHGDGRVSCWGDCDFGGDGPEELEHACRVVASGRSFAALRRDGSVVCWGKVSDTRGVEDELKDVRYIASSYGAFAALRGDGRVVTWGDRNYGANSSSFQADLHDVQIISGASEGFAAVRADGAIICWDRLGKLDVKQRA